MAFERPIAPRKRQSRKDSRFVLLDSFGKRLQLWQGALFYRAEPDLQLLSCMLSHHLHKRLCQPVSGFCTRTSLSDESQFALLCLIQIIGVMHEQKG